ncbi:MAG: hypothetical protein KDD25_04315 [Bdellovibrionales bacterium]|nr:hypothetical protein [Bdellovibrionales bacterium]
MKVRFQFFVIFLCIFVLGCSRVSKSSGSGHSNQEEPGQGILNPSAPFEKVFIIVFENTDAAKALKQPYFKYLASKGAYLNKFYAVTHPSQGNYVALTAGNLHGVSGDGDYDLDVTSIADLLEENGMTWKSYAEDYPGDCFNGTKSGKYYRKHNPFISYLNIQQNPLRCSNIVSSDQLWEDIRNNELPTYSFYVPDIDNDGHDTGVAFADKWLKENFSDLIEDEDFMKDMLFVVTFDESTFFGGNKIYTALLGSGVIPNKKSEVRYDLYSLLRTIEDGLGIGTLNQKDETAVPIDDVWL